MPDLIRHQVSDRDTLVETWTSDQVRGDGVCGGARVETNGGASGSIVAYIPVMNAPLYNVDILRLAASIPHHEPLSDPMGSSERRSPICGSRVTVDVNLADGCVAEIGMLVRACALGQASSSLFAAHAIGKTPGDLATARDELTAWLAGEGPVPGWPDLDIFVPALGVTARHPAIRLAFEAGAEAAALATVR